METHKVTIQTADAFAAESQVLALDAVISVSIVTATAVRVMYKPHKIESETKAGAVDGSIISE